jgi:hypothetical protein
MGFLGCLSEGVELMGIVTKLRNSWLLHRLEPHPGPLLAIVYAEVDYGGWVA